MRFAFAGQDQFVVAPSDPPTTGVSGRRIEPCRVIWVDCSERGTIRNIVLAAGGRHQIREGRSFERVVIVEFDSFDQAVACYDDAGYQELIPVALKAYGNDREFTIVDGDGKFTSPD